MSILFDGQTGLSGLMLLSHRSCMSDVISGWDARSSSRESREDPFAASGSLLEHKCLGA